MNSVVRCPGRRHRLPDYVVTFEDESQRVERVRLRVRRIAWPYYSHAARLHSTNARRADSFRKTSGAFPQTSPRLCSSLRLRISTGEIPGGFPDFDEADRFLIIPARGPLAFAPPRHRS